jgi:hypothetical protein
MVFWDWASKMLPMKDTDIGEVIRIYKQFLVYRVFFWLILLYELTIKLY